MTASLSHRGPDDEGQWTDSHEGVALGHRRLKVVDLSPRGSQPMTSASGRYVISCNGEVYNFMELRRELESAGHGFRGRSDTEVMLAAFEHWGVERAVKRFIGMFAFAVWDAHERRLHLVRDRIGEKPLYYGWIGDTFLFGSELKALRAHGGGEWDVDRESLALFMRFNYIPAPRSIYKGIRKQTPATIITLDLRHLDAGLVPVESAYWSAEEAAQRGIDDPFDARDAEVVNYLHALLRASVRQQMIADVPSGAFLSGGIDSSTVVALMQEESARPVKTYTIGFDEKEYNEADYAKAVAQRLGTEHTEMRLSASDSTALITDLPAIYDEPMSDSSQIAVLAVSRLARRSVTVALSGDGGDELFGGYPRYVVGDSLWRKVRLLPPSHRRAVAALIRKFPATALNMLGSGLHAATGHLGAAAFVGDKVHTLAGLVGVRSSSGFYEYLISLWKDPSAIVLGAEASPPTVITPGYAERVSDFRQRMMLMDAASYLPDDLLVKVDRASMSVSLETRAPFLDHRVAEFAWRLPAKLKVKNGKGKWPLRQLLKRYLPDDLIERPKMGFSIPLDKWLRGPLRDWAESLLCERRLRREGFLDPTPIRRVWAEHLSGRRDRQHHIFAVLVFEAWLDAASRKAHPHELG